MEGTEQVKASPNHRAGPCPVCCDGHNCEGTESHDGHAKKLSSRGLVTLENNTVVTYDPGVPNSVDPLCYWRRN